MIQIETLVVTDFQQNARILYDVVTREAVAVDPGGEGRRLIDFIDSNKLMLTQIWLTHSHVDHCGGVSDLVTKYNARLYGHRIEQDFRANVISICRMYGMPEEDMLDCPEPDEYIQEGSVVNLGAVEFKVFFTPGHSPGHVVFYSATEGVVLAGDTLFNGSIGRSDLPGGNGPQLLLSIRQKLLSLPPDTRVLCGHGPDTTIGHEINTNPWLQE